MDPALLSILACPRCKGRLEAMSEGGGLACPQCKLSYPVRQGIPVLMAEEASSLKTIANEPIGPIGAIVHLVVVEGKNKGEVIELKKGSCRAVGRSLDDTERTRVLSVESAVNLDDFSKKLVINYISKQFKKGAESAVSGDQALESFEREPDIFLRDRAVSRLHAMIFYDETGVGILDLVSKNGTFVNGAEIESRLLKKGDLVMIGSTKFRLE